MTKDIMHINFKVKDPDLIDFLSGVPTGKRTEILNDSLKQYHLNLDRSLIQKEINNLQFELNKLKTLMDSAEVSEQSRDKRVSILAAHESAVEFFGWYQTKAKADATIANQWLGMVIEDISKKIGLKVTVEDFKLALTKRQAGGGLDGIYA